MSYPLCNKLGFDAQGRRERLELLALATDDLPLARQLHEQVLVASREPIIDAFYRYLLGNAQTLAFLRDAQVVARLKRTQSDYLSNLGIDFDGIDYFEERLRIGLAHARIGLPLSLYQCAYARLRELILEHLPDNRSQDPDAYRELVRFVGRITALDMSLAIESYHHVRLEGLEDRIHDLRTEHARLSWQVQFDSLTNVATRGYALSVLEEQLTRLNDSRGGLCVVIADLDNFKQVNDGYGHVVGDRALQESAARINGAVRDFDLVGRYGGEEFVIVLPDTTQEMALRVAERVRAKFDNSPLHIDDELVRMTVSLGCTQARAGDDVGAVIARADEALYNAKHGGRNRVICYEHAARR